MPPYGIIETLKGVKWIRRVSDTISHVSIGHLNAPSHVVMVFCSRLEFHLEKEPNELLLVWGVVEVIEDLGVS